MEPSKNPLVVIRFGLSNRHDLMTVYSYRARIVASYWPRLEPIGPETNVGLHGARSNPRFLDFSSQLAARSVSVLGLNCTLLACVTLRTTRATSLPIDRNAFAFTFPFVSC